MNNLNKLKYLVIDVDGTMTDASIYYDEHGNELKKFCTKDAAGFFAAHEAGIKIMVLTGRKCAATTRRMEEMAVEYVYQDVKDKESFLKQFMTNNQMVPDMLGYIGDDLNDLLSMKLCGFVGCPLDSSREVKDVADYVSQAEGGHGAVRDIIEHILRKQGVWENVINRVYGSVC